MVKNNEENIANVNSNYDIFLKKFYKDFQENIHIKIKY